MCPPATLIRTILFRSGLLCSGFHFAKFLECLFVAIFLLFSCFCQLKSFGVHVLAYLQIVLYIVSYLNAKRFEEPLIIALEAKQNNAHGQGNSVLKNLDPQKTLFFGAK